MGIRLNHIIGPAKMAAAHAGYVKGLADHLLKSPDHARRVWADEVKYRPISTGFRLFAHSALHVIADWKSAALLACGALAVHIFAPAVLTALTAFALTPVGAVAALASAALIGFCLAQVEDAANFKYADWMNSSPRQGFKQWSAMAGHARGVDAKSFVLL